MFLNFKNKQGALSKYKLQDIFINEDFSKDTIKKL